MAVTCMFGMVRFGTMLATYKAQRVRLELLVLPVLLVPRVRQVQLVRQAPLDRKVFKENPALWVRQVPKVTPEILVQLEHRANRGRKVQLVPLDQKVLQVLRVRLDHRVKLDQLVHKVRKVRLVLKELRVKADNLLMRQPLVLAL